MSNRSKMQTGRAMIEAFNEEIRADFTNMGDGGRYTNEQKAYAFGLIEEMGVRATARVLKIPRRTLQRWCREYHVRVRRCPSWVYAWAERRRKRRRFWRHRGY